MTVIETGRGDRAHGTYLKGNTPCVCDNAIVQMGGEAKGKPTRRDQQTCRGGSLTPRLKLARC